MDFAQLFKDARERAAKALESAREIRTRATAAEAWSAEDRQEFDRAMKDFASANTEAEENRQQMVQLDELSAAETEYFAPAAGRAPRSAQELLTEREQKAKSHRGAFMKYLYGGENMLTQGELTSFVRNVPQVDEALAAGIHPREAFALVSDVDSLGGFLVPEDFVNELIKDLAGFTVIRPRARVRQTNRAAATFMTVATTGTDPYVTGVSGAWKGQGYVTGGTAIPTQDQPTFGRERVPVHLWSPDVIELTQELMEDAAVDLDAEIRMILAEHRGLDEDSAFINGTGVGHPEGILNAGIATVQSGAANGMSYGGLVDMWTTLPAQYRQRDGVAWLMNSLTYGLVLLLEDGASQLIVNPTRGVYTDIPHLFNKPIIFSEFMPDGDTDTNKAVVLGDFGYYAIADRRDLRIQRLVERYAPNVGILASARVGGQVLRTNPFRIMVVGA